MKGLLFLMLFLSACVRQEDVSLALDWTPNTRHIGFYVAQDKGLYRKEGLNLKIIEANSKPENLVAARKADFGISYLTEVLLAYQNNLSINVIAALVRQDLSGWAVNKEGVTSLKELEGKTYGSYGGAKELARLKRIFKLQGADFSTVRVLEISAPGVVPFGKDLPNAPDFINTFEDWAFVDLKLQGKKVSFIPKRNFENQGEYYSPVLITSEALLENDPKKVTAFLRATEAGYRYAYEHPAEAVDIFVKHNPEYSKEFISESLKILKPNWFTETGRWGVMDLEVWQERTQEWIDAGLINPDFDPKVLVAERGLDDTAI